ncbi:MAG: hypothetical protein O9972_42090 [Burkholderiales bacterium]|nr:hypothetical protein [Burkholderiales bacterium]
MSSPSRTRGSFITIGVGSPARSTRHRLAMLPACIRSRSVKPPISMPGSRTRPTGALPLPLRAELRAARRRAS